MSDDFKYTATLERVHVASVGGTIRNMPERATSPASDNRSILSIASDESGSIRDTV